MADRAHVYSAELISPTFHKSMPHFKSPKEYPCYSGIRNCGMQTFSHLRSQPIHFPLNYYALLFLEKKKKKAKHEPQKLKAQTLFPLCAFGGNGLLKEKIALLCPGQ